jgi:hypothetical protein
MATNRLEGLIELAVESDALLSTLVAINRLATYQSFDGIQSSQMVRRLLGKYKEPVLAAIPVLIAGRLLNESDKLALLAADVDVRERLKSAYYLDGVIGYLAEWASKYAIAPEPRSAAEAALHDLLVAANARTVTSNILLRRSFEFEPDFYREALYLRLHEEVEAETSQHLIGALLRAAEPLSRVEPLIRSWLAHNAGAESASFVLGNWLRRNPDLETVESIVRNWLRIYSRHKVAVYVMIPWLMTQKPLDTIIGFVMQWVEAHPDEYEVTSLYAEILRWSPDPLPTIITEQAFHWLNKFAQEPSAWRLLRAWLGRPLDPAAIVGPLTIWLSKNIAGPYAGGVLAAWMVAGGEMDIIRDFNAQLDIDAYDPSWTASFLANWLTRSPQDETARNRTFEWFSKNLKNPASTILTKKVAGASRLPIATAMNILRWAKEFKNDPAAINRVSLAFHGEYASDPSFPAYLRLLSDTVHAIISFEEDEPTWSPYERTSAGMMLSNLVLTAGQHEQYSRVCDLLIGRAITSQTIFRGDSGIRYCPVLVWSLKRLIQFGGFGFGAAKLKPFLDWIRATADESNRKGAEHMLAEIGIAL